MKNSITRILVICFISMCFGLQAQSNETLKREDVEEATTGKSSVIFKFEPDYLVSVEKERKQQKRNREILDTLSISERKKKKLLKKMFKSDFSEHLSKTRVADTKFEDVNN